MRTKYTGFDGLVGDTGYLGLPYILGHVEAELNASSLVFAGATGTNVRLRLVFDNNAVDIDVGLTSDNASDILQAINDALVSGSTRYGEAKLIGRRIAIFNYDDSPTARIVVREDNMALGLLASDSTTTGRTKDVPVSEYTDKKFIDMHEPLAWEVFNRALTAVQDNVDIVKRFSNIMTLSPVILKATLNGSRWRISHKHALILVPSLESISLYYEESGDFFPVLSSDGSALHPTHAYAAGAAQYFPYPEVMWESTVSLHDGNIIKTDTSVSFQFEFLIAHVSGGNFSNFPVLLKRLADDKMEVFPVINSRLPGKINNIKVYSVLGYPSTPLILWPEVEFELDWDSSLGDPYIGVFVLRIPDEAFDDYRVTAGDFIQSGVEIVSHLKSTTEYYRERDVFAGLIKSLRELRGTIWSEINSTNLLFGTDLSVERSSIGNLFESAFGPLGSKARTDYYTDSSTLPDHVGSQSTTDFRFLSREVKSSRIVHSEPPSYINVPASASSYRNTDDGFVVLKIDSEYFNLSHQGKILRARLSDGSYKVARVISVLDNKTVILADPYGRYLSWSELPNQIQIEAPMIFGNLASYVEDLNQIQSSRGLIKSILERSSITVDTASVFLSAQLVAQNVQITYDELNDFYILDSSASDIITRYAHFEHSLLVLVPNSNFLRAGIVVEIIDPSLRHVKVKTLGSKAKNDWVKDNLIADLYVVRSASSIAGATDSTITLYASSVRDVGNDDDKALYVIGSSLMETDSNIALQLKSYDAELPSYLYDYEKALLGVFQTPHKVIDEPSTGDIDLPISIQANGTADLTAIKAKKIYGRMSSTKNTIVGASKTVDLPAISDPYLASLNHRASCSVSNGQVLLDRYYDFDSITDFKFLAFIGSGKCYLLETKPSGEVRSFSAQVPDGEYELWVATGSASVFALPDKFPDFIGSWFFTEQTGSNVATAIAFFDSESAVRVWSDGSLTEGSWTLCHSSVGRINADTIYSSNTLSVRSDVGYIKSRVSKSQNVVPSHDSVLAAPSIGLLPPNAVNETSVIFNIPKPCTLLGIYIDRPSSVSETGWTDVGTSINLSDFSLYGIKLKLNNVTDPPPVAVDVRLTIGTSLDLRIVKWVFDIPPLDGVEVFVPLPRYLLPGQENSFSGPFYVTVESVNLLHPVEAPGTNVTQYKLIYANEDNIIYVSAKYYTPKVGPTTSLPQYSQTNQSVLIDPSPSMFNASTGCYQYDYGVTKVRKHFGGTQFGLSIGDISEDVFVITEAGMPIYPSVCAIPTLDYLLVKDNDSDDHISVINPLNCWLASGSQLEVFYWKTDPSSPIGPPDPRRIRLIVGQLFKPVYINEINLGYDYLVVDYNNSRGTYPMSFFVAHGTEMFIEKHKAAAFWQSQLKLPPALLDTASEVYVFPYLGSRFGLIQNSAYYFGEDEGPQQDDTWWYPV